MTRSKHYRRNSDDFKAKVVRLTEVEGVLSKDVAESLGKILNPEAFTGPAKWMTTLFLIILPAISLTSCGSMVLDLYRTTAPYSEAFDKSADAILDLNSFHISGAQPQRGVIIAEQEITRSDGRSVVITIDVWEEKNGEVLIKVRVFPPTGTFWDFTDVSSILRAYEQAIRKRIPVRNWSP